MTTHRAAFASHSPDATAHLATSLGAVLKAGDCLLLSGGIGAGKSHFARALIQSRLSEPEDVPSPTFTLVQTYDLPECELWHADLYRLGAPDQIIELGLLDAFETAITLIEWPDRLQDLTPSHALHLDIQDSNHDDTRQITLTWTDPKWSDVMARVVT
ncbi:tRNA (adenosine(37)-N6)-threonylcarbamoyltransferase complex ATPase subunit type 1 TsaE [Marivita sp. S0852]|uniref:tRNA (adenosine(37)-N6)-threonylcarbamoyltransferase complex ATPase subunit type 1 TsaE n=1 Tax=Marivita sp. S0852 TaxID=3373893 RepID=UPI00398239CC